MEAIVAAVAILGGLAFGSFSTVLAARIPEGSGVVAGRSACPTCGTEIHWRDNVPVVSWLLLRGRCRSCGGPISWTYPAMELTVAALWLGAYLTYGLSWATAALVALAVASVALVAVDARLKRLPHRIVLPAHGIVLVPMIAAWLTGERETWIPAMVGAAAMGGFYGLLWLVYPKGMGFGDVTTAVLLGLVAGFLGWDVLAVAAIAGPLLGGVLTVVLLARGKVGRRSTIPYGPALIAGAWCGYLFGPAIAHAYLAMLGVA